MNAQKWKFFAYLQVIRCDKSRAFFSENAD